MNLEFSHYFISILLSHLMFSFRNLYYKFISLVFYDLSIPYERKLSKISIKFRLSIYQSISDTISRQKPKFHSSVVIILHRVRSIQINRRLKFAFQTDLTRPSFLALQLPCKPIFFTEIAFKNARNYISWIILCIVSHEDLIEQKFSKCPQNLSVLMTQ